MNAFEDLILCVCLPASCACLVPGKPEEGEGASGAEVVTCYVGAGN